MSHSSKKVIYAAMAGNGLIAITKFIAAAVTGSSAMLSEGIHSVVDTGNQVLLLHGLKQAKKPADAQFPFGYGKEIYFWSFVVAISIFSIGAGVSIYEGINHLRSDHQIANPMINYIVLFLAFIFEAIAWTIAFKEFSITKGKRGYWQAIHEGKDPSLFVVLFEDTAAMLGIIIAFFGVLLTSLTHNPLYDGVASIFIGLILAVTAFFLAMETKGLLIGESANLEVVKSIKNLSNDCPEVLKVNEVLTMHIGPDNILVNISVEFMDSVTTTGIEKVIDQLEDDIRSKHPRVKRIFIEAESISKPRKPANPASDKNC